jgi:hypothetical protein
MQIVPKPPPGSEPVQPQPTIATSPGIAQGPGPAPPDGGGAGPEIAVDVQEPPSRLKQLHDLLNNPIFHTLPNLGPIPRS